MATLDQNKALVLRLYEEVINQHNLAVMDELLDRGFVHNGDPRGLVGQRAAVELLFAAMPDIGVVTHAAVAENDLVVVRQTWSGTQKGPFMGSPASGHRLTFSSMAMLRISAGRIAEAWVNEDDLALMQQVGAIPKPS